MTTGDGNFQWWYGTGKEPEIYSGPYDSREQAIGQAHAEDGKECGFTICEADRAVAGDDIFDAGNVLENYEEHNCECWGEDGADINASGVQRRDLERMLAATLAVWFEKNSNRPRPWSFGEMRNEEYFPPVDTATSA